MCKKDKLKAIAAGILTGFINGFFGSGGGIIAVCYLTRFTKTDQKNAQSTAIMVILPLAVISSLIYMKNIEFNIEGLWQIIGGGVAGALTGAFFLSKINNTLLKKIFGIFIIFFAVRMIIG